KDHLSRARGRITVMHMRIRKDDNVTIIAGKNKGKSGKVLQAFPESNKVAVEGVNVTVKHLKLRRPGEKGQKVEYNAPLSVTNVMLVCPKCTKPTRVATKAIEDKSG